jgi:CRP-like cAMP-binding protein
MSNAELQPPHREILASGRWFASLPPALQQALCERARLVTLRAGEVLFARGDENDGLYGVLEGAIRFGAVNAAGRESVVGLAERPQWFGEVALLDGGRRTHHASAESDATLAHVPLPAIVRWLAEHPAHWQHVGQLAVHKLRTVFAEIEDASPCSPRARLVRCLIALAHGYGQREGPPLQSLNVSQERLGSILALSRQTVNALLQEMERERLLVCVRGGVRILDFRRLLEIGASAP